ncbi:MAG: hypothetical protein QXX08_04070 [Candidatus Bathyarchaeia archaeon]
MKKLAIAIVLMLIGTSLATLTSPVWAPQPTPDPGNYQIIFQNVVYNSIDDTSTWFYIVKSLGSPAISHIVFEFKTCDPSPLEDLFVDAGGTLAGGSVTWDVGTDPPTGKYGIKFEFNFDDSEPETWEANVWFTLKGQWDENGIEVWVKAGHQDPYQGPSYNVEGPACFVIPEIPGTISAIVATFAALGFLAKKRSISIKH